MAQDVLPLLTRTHFGRFFGGREPQKKAATTTRLAGRGVERLLPNMMQQQQKDKCPPFYTTSKPPLIILLSFSKREREKGEAKRGKSYAKFHVRARLDKL